MNTRLHRAGLIASMILAQIAHQVQRDTHAGIINAKALYRWWMREYWPRVHPVIKAPVFAAGISARTIYRAGHHAGRTIAIGAHNGLDEGRARYREYLELREHIPGTSGYLHVSQRIAADRRVRAGVYREYGEQVHGAAVRDREERNEWARAENLAELGEITARWIQGDTKYHPGYVADSVDDETIEIIPDLVKLNLAGFVTSASQPGTGPQVGFDGNRWWQRAAVDGFTDPDIANRLEKACEEAGLIFINNGHARWRTNWRNAELVTVSFVNPDDGQVPPEASDALYYGHTSFGTHLSRRAVRFSFNGYGTNALLSAEQITIIDPEWGRKGHLWDTITRAVAPIHTPAEMASAKTGQDTGGDDLAAVITSANGVPFYPGEPAGTGDWRVTVTNGNRTEVIASGVSREYALQMTAWQRWWMETRRESGHVTSGPVPSEANAGSASPVPGARPAKEWGIARPGPDGQVIVDTYLSRESAEENIWRYQWIPNTRGDGRPLYPIVTRRGDGDWVFAATGWPLNGDGIGENTAAGDTEVGGKTVDSEDLSDTGTLTAEGSRANQRIW